MADNPPDLHQSGLLATCASSWWGSLLVLALIVGPFLDARWLPARHARHGVPNVSPFLLSHHGLPAKEGAAARMRCLSESCVSRYKGPSLLLHGVCYASVG
eukprot:1139885-Pelagomonas_calceolata.AAC.8